jgi:hypothetical protein
MTVSVDVVDPSSVETGRPTDDSMDLSQGDQKQALVVVVDEGFENGSPFQNAFFMETAHFPRLFLPRMPIVL